jgi:hypothetical protein
MVIFKPSQDNPYLGFGMYLLLLVGFMMYANNKVECDEELEYEYRKNSRIRMKDDYYYLINFQ